MRIGNYELSVMSALASVTYAIPKLESASICHKIIPKCKYIYIRMTSAIQAKVACANQFPASISSTSY